MNETMEAIKSAESNYPIAANGILNFATTSDGKKIRFALWPTGTRGLIIFLNGRNEYIEKYNETYIRFQELGFSVVTLDWRSQGLSDRPEWARDVGYVESFEKYQLDLAAVLKESSVQAITGKRILVAHSTGGCIGLRTILQKTHNISGAIFLSPFWDWGNAFGAPMVRNFIASIHKSFTALGLGKLPSGPKKKKPYVLTQTAQNNSLTSDKQQFDRLQKIISLDSRLSAGPPSVSWIAFADQEMKELREQSESSTPSIVLIASDDTLVSLEAARKMCDGNEHWKLKIFENARHELLIEKNKTVESVWKEIRTFLNALDGN